MPSLQSLAAALTSSTSTKTSSCYLIELDKSTDALVKNRNGQPAYVGFQYFPETLTDSKSINYQQKEIPGGSLPLYQWVASGERLLSFTAVFTCDVDYGRGVPASATSTAEVEQQVSGQEALRTRLKNVGQLRRNPDLRGAVAWLRRYMVPTYDASFTYAPNKLRLFLPNSGIGYAGGSDGVYSNPDSIACVMTQCEVTYEAFFPSGWCRALSVSLSFAQIPQFNGGVFFPNANKESGIQSYAGFYSRDFPK